MNENETLDTVGVPFFGEIEFIPNMPHNYFLRIQKKLKFLDDFRKYVDMVEGTLDPNETYLERFAKSVREDFSRPYNPWLHVVHHTPAGKIQLLVTININPHQPLGRFPILLDICLHRVIHTDYADSKDISKVYKETIDEMVLDMVE